MYDRNALRRYLEAGGDPRDLGMSVDDMTGEMTDPAPQGNALRAMMEQAGAQNRDVLAAPQAYSMSGSPTASVNGDFQVFAGDGRPQERDLTQAVQAAQVQRQAMQPQGQGQGPIGGPMRVVGAGNGSTVELSPEVAPARVDLDYSRPAVDVPGVGKVYYDKSGRGAYAVDGNGRPTTKVILGYDMQGSMALQRSDLANAKTRQDIAQSRASVEHTQEQIAASQQARNQKEGLPGAGVPQSILEKQYGKAPEGKRWTISGTLEDIPGGSGKPLTESQGKATGLAYRAQAAHDILTGLEAQGVMTPSLIKQGVETVPLVGGGLGMAVNRFGSPEQQRVEQAQRDFVNAALRVESGASISDSEFNNARKQYFPQPGDSPETIRQKQQAREREIASLGMQAGPGADKVKAAPAGASMPDPKQNAGRTIRDTVSGKRYRSDGKSWIIQG